MIKSVLLFVYHCWYLLRKNIIVKSGDVIFTRIKVAKMNILYGKYKSSAKQDFS